MTDVMTKLMRALSITGPGEFSITYKGPAIREQKGMDATLVAAAMKSTGVLMREAARTTVKSPVRLYVCGIGVTDDQFTIRFHLREEPGSTKTPVTVDEFVGHDPDFTGGLTTEEYMEKLRG